MYPDFDGPPTAWFEGKNKRYSYVVYAIGGDNPEELLQMAAAHIAQLQTEGIIVWRRRPEIAFNPETFYDAEYGIEPTPAHWKVTYRCTVIPFDGDAEFPPVKDEGERIQIL